ncbi:hypothetical protein AB4298_12805 [Shewanella sp. 10N.261.52.F9]|uniref:hypothetical protein n=1 Tax=Shewanella sp. 10N.261.52.F9 TaxID=3229684 RepID=UPI00354DAA3E
MSFQQKFYLHVEHGFTSFISVTVLKSPESISAVTTVHFSNNQRFTKFDLPYNVADWSIELDKSTEKQCRLAPDIILNVKGVGLGSLTRNAVIAEAKIQFAGHSLRPGKLTEKDGNIDNFKRRHHFYTNSGFKVIYNEDELSGTIECNDLSLLNPSTTSLRKHNYVDTSIEDFFATKNSQIEQLNSKIRVLEATAAAKPEQHWINAKNFLIFALAVVLVLSVFI